MEQADISDEEAARLLHSRADFIPVELDPISGRLVWQALDKYHIYEGEFSTAIHTVRAMQKHRQASLSEHCFVTNASVLDHLDVPQDCLAPTGFIFSTSRCGSTLLTRALARNRQSIVLGEPMVLLHLLQWMSGASLSKDLNTALNRDRLRKLVLLMGRRRRAEYCRYVIKFPSIGIHFADTICATFTNVPTLFLYREPAAVLASHAKQATGWDATKDHNWGQIFADSPASATVSLEEYRCRVLRKIYKLALSEKFSQWRFLNYSDLSTKNLAAILSFLDHGITDKDRVDMDRVFSSYSKSHYLNVPFNPVTPREESLGAEIPSTNIPSADNPSAHIPSADNPSAHIPSAHIPSADYPSADYPSADNSSAGNPSAGNPSAQLSLNADFPAHISQSLQSLYREARTSPRNLLPIPVGHVGDV